MITAIVSNILSASRIEEAAKRAGKEIKITDPEKTGLDSSCYIIDFNASSGLATARRIRSANPAAKITGFYPHMNKEIKEAAERFGYDVFPNSQFFSDIEKIISKI